MAKAFASQSDLTDKTITFEQLSAHCWAYTAEGDPNSGVVIGDQFINQAGKEAAAANMDLKAAMSHTRKSMDPLFGHVFIYEHCLPFDVTRAVDEASGIKHPRIWTAERDKEMWFSLQN